MMNENVETTMFEYHPSISEVLKSEPRKRTAEEIVITGVDETE